jgi:hypothetical protein
MNVDLKNTGKHRLPSTDVNISTLQSNESDSAFGLHTSRRDGAIPNLS